MATVEQDETMMTSDQLAARQVCSYDAGTTLDGAPSAELVRESDAAEPTGAVPAFRDAAGIWQFVPPSQVDHFRRHLHETVMTVFVARDEVQS